MTNLILSFVLIALSAIIKLIFSTKNATTHDNPKKGLTPEAWLDLKNGEFGKLYVFLTKLSAASGFKEELWNRPCHPITDLEKAELYRDLPIDESSIRVIRLWHPIQRPPSPLVCQLERIKLSDRFVALSWAWQGLPGYSNILMNGKVWGVPANLAVALLQIQNDAPPNDSILVWVDALCIDQNGREREKELLRMYHIYSKAAQVILWIGQSTAQTDTVFEEVDTMVNRNGLSGQPGWLVNKKRSLTVGVLESYRRNAKLWGAFGRRVMEQRVWYRRWIVQELVAATDPLVRCGRNTMPWWAFNHIQDVSSRHNLNIFGLTPSETEYDVFQNQQKSLYEVNELRERLQAGAKLSLTELLTNLQQYDTEKPEDLIYSVLAIASDSHTIPKPDYTMGYATVWTDVTRALVDRSGNLDILALGHGKRRDSSIPSWAPDFALHYRAQAAMLPLSTSHTKMYNASHGQKHTVSWSRPKSLLVQGFLVDVITKTSIEFDLYPSIGARRQEDELDTKFGEFMDQITDMAWGGLNGPYKSSVYPHTSETNYKALSRTLVADLEHDTIYASRQSGNKPGALGEQRAVPSSFMPGIAPEVRQSSWTRMQVGAKLRYLNYRKFITTQQGHMGLAPAESVAGDSIVIMNGATLPFVLRRTDTGERFSSVYSWQVIGASYIHGIMDGEFASVRQTVTSASPFLLV